MDKLSTRKGAISDIEIIVQFQKNMALETEERILLESSISSGVTEVIGDEQKGTYLVAEHEGKIIGSLLITYEWSDWRNGWFWWIQSVYVKKEWRRKGVSRRPPHARRPSGGRPGAPQKRAEPSSSG